jgi:hypothetical protein
MKKKILSLATAALLGLGLWACSDSSLLDTQSATPKSARISGKEPVSFDGQMLVFATQEDFVNTVEQLQTSQGEATQAMVSALESKGLKTEDQVSEEIAKSDFDINAPLKKYAQSFGGFTSMLDANAGAVQKFYDSPKLDAALDPEKDLPEPSVQALVNQNLEVKIGNEVVSLKIRLPYKGCSPFQSKSFSTYPSSSRYVTGWLFSSPFSVSGTTYAKYKIRYWWFGWKEKWVPAITRLTRTCKEGIVYSAWDCKTERSIANTCVTFPAASGVIQFFPLMGVKPGTNHWRTKHEVPGWGFSQTINN